MTHCFIRFKILSINVWWICNIFLTTPIPDQVLDITRLYIALWYLFYYTFYQYIITSYMCEALQQNDIKIPVHVINFNDH